MKRRNTKKDIEYLSYQVLDECFYTLARNKQENSDRVKEIMQETIAMRNNLIDRVNHPDGKDNPKMVKTHFRNIYESLFDKVHQFLQELDEINK